MGYRSALERISFAPRQKPKPSDRARESTPAGGPTCDQAVFTSVRSATGEGYRIIAASPGVRPHEKIAITRRSPSHEALCQGDASAEGLTSFALTGDRHCVGYSCYAGTEHTARGGQRVYTHLLILDRDTFRKFDADPVRICHLLAAGIEQHGPVLDVCDRLPPFALPLVDADGERALLIPGTRPVAADWIWPITGRILSGQRLVVLNAPESMSLLRSALLCVPRNLRETFDGSVGITLSRNRKSRLAFVSGDEAHVRHQTEDEKVELWTADAPPDSAMPPQSGWLNLLRRWWQQDRREELVRFTTQTCADAGAESLDRVAEIAEDIDRITSMNMQVLDDMLTQYQRRTGPTSAEKTLIKRFVSQATDRLTMIRRRQKETETAKKKAATHPPDSSGTPGDAATDNYRHRV